MEDDKKRWYDSQPLLAEMIEKMQFMESEKTESILRGIKNIVDKFDPDFIDKNVLEFPMSDKRRWYDDEPQAWLVINCLQYADSKMMSEVLVYLKTIKTA